MSTEVNSNEQTLKDLSERIYKGGAPKYHQKNSEQGKLFVRDRLKLLFDAEFELEDALFRGRTSSRWCCDCDGEN
jgi:acetyl-CoA carboxylase carboxyltransferase component